MVPLNLILDDEMIVDELLDGNELLKNQIMNQDDANEVADQVQNEARDEMVNHREAIEVEVIIHETQNHMRGHHVSEILEIKEITKETQKRKENRLLP
jgi:glyoxylate carboligase